MNIRDINVACSQNGKWNLFLISGDVPRALPFFSGDVPERYFNFWGRPQNSILISGDVPRTLFLISGDVLTVN